MIFDNGCKDDILDKELIGFYKGIFNTKQHRIISTWTGINNEEEDIVTKEFNNYINSDLYLKYKDLINVVNNRPIEIDEKEMFKIIKNTKGGGTGFNSLLEEQVFYFPANEYTYELFVRLYKADKDYNVLLNVYK